MAKTLADTHYEYAIQTLHSGSWHQVTKWNPNPNPYKPGHTPNKDERIVRRIVTQPEEVQP